jgi:hypothetical protein
MTIALPVRKTSMPTQSSGIDEGSRIVQRSTAGKPTPVRLRSVRPSLLDVRFRGDAWIVADDEGLWSLYLENSCLVHLQLLSFDVAALNGALQQMRSCRPCCRMRR